MATDQEMTIVDVIHAALDRLPVSMAITIVSGIYAELCSESGVSKQRAVGFLERRYEEYDEMIKSDKKEIEMQPFLALITPVSSGEPSHPIAPGGPPPQVWPGPGYPAHPIAPGGPPPGIWPSPGHPAHPIAPGGGPTHPIVIPPDAIAPGVPTHPIYIPVYPAHPIVIPPGSLGGGKPEHPIFLPPSSPGHPAHPIVIPPDAVEPGVPSHPIVIPPPPLGIWGGGNQPFPTPPIFLPPDSPDREKLIEWHIGWSENTGWVVVGVPNPPHPVPST